MQEIITRLNLGAARQFVADFDRPNIRYRIEPKAEPLKQLLTLLRTEHPGDAGIVYCLSRASVEKTATFLDRNGITAMPYHAGLDARTRTANQARFQREDGLVMVATIAFGMGIDKPDVRFVATTLTCRSRSSATTRKPGARAVTASRPPHGWGMAWPTWCCSDGSSIPQRVT